MNRTQQRIDFLLAAGFRECPDLGEACFSLLDFYVEFQGRTDVQVYELKEGHFTERGIFSTPEADIFSFACFLHATGALTFVELRRTVHEYPESAAILKEPLAGIQTELSSADLAIQYLNTPTLIRWQ